MESSKKGICGAKKCARNPRIVVFDEGRVFIFSDGKWTFHMTVKHRVRPAMAFIPGRNVFIVAGGNDEGSLLSFVEVLDLSAMTWKDGPPMATVRDSSAGVCLADGTTFMVCGGYDGTQLSSCELFDGEKWSSAANMSASRGDHSTVLYKDKPVALGGYSGEESLATAEQYDHSTNVWAPFPSFEMPRSSFGAAVVLDKIYVTGGVDYHSMGWVEVFDGNAWSFLSSGLPSGCRYNHTAVCFEDKLVVLGGTILKMDVYDPIDDEWVVNGSVIQGEYCIAGVY